MSNRPPRPVRKAARAALKMAAQDLDLMGELGFPTVSIEWCDRSEIGGNTGETRGFEEHKIWVANDMTVEETARTIFHELRHLQRLRKGKIPAFQTRLNRETEEEEERIAHGHSLWMWRKFRDEFESEPWFDGDQTTTG